MQSDIGFNAGCSAGKIYLRRENMKKLRYAAPIVQSYEPPLEDVLTASNGDNDGNYKDEWVEL